MQQTAVEWLAEQMMHPSNYNPYIERAKEIEKQQQGYSEEDLKDAFQSGFTNGFNMNSVTFEEWFEQFKKKQLMEYLKCTKCGEEAHTFKEFANGKCRFCGGELEEETGDE